MTANPQSAIRNPQWRRRGFTLMELLIVILIIGLLVGLSVAALVGAAEQARASRTRSIINKLDQLILSKYDSYRTRRLPIRTTGASPQVAGQVRLAAMRELMRMELPDRRTDVVDYGSATRNPESTASGMPLASLQRMYWRKALVSVGGDPNNVMTYAALNNWTRQHQGSECLYLIVSAMHDGDKNAIDFFSPDEIGDVDADGMKEILDGWGNPIEFLRWAPAYTTQNVGEITQQNGNGSLAPDPFDPVRADPRWRDSPMPNGNEPYYLRPLIFSPGKDDSYDVSTILEDPNSMNSDFRYSRSHTYGSWNVANDPYFQPPAAWSQLPLGSVGDIDGDGNAGGWLDNITNHYQEPQP
jgi:prepilin-type N-terminal cleavage/methylation domain-containing protein